MNAIIKETDINNVIGTSFYNDTINANVNELISILRVEPFKDFDVKTKFEWRLEYYSEILNKRFYFTIYDYNEDWESHIESATGVNDYLYTTKIDWHIGGKSADDTILAKFALTNKLKEFRNESSINAKNRNIDIAKKMVLNGCSYNNIMNFAIISAENPDSKKDMSSNIKKNMKTLSDILKNEHYTFVRQDGHFGGNPEHSYIIFNITQEMVARLSGKFEQTSFFYCYPDDKGNIVNEYWEKKDTKAFYDSIKNPYVFINKTVKVHNENDADDFYSVIGNDYKYSIDCEVFNKVNYELNKGLNNLRSKFNLINESNDDLLEYIYNTTGPKASAYKKVFNNID